MERLRQKEGGGGGAEERPLTDAQKAAIAEARNVHKAKVAEREILQRDNLRRATSHEEVDQLGDQLRRDLERLASERDRKIEEIRQRAG
jgi:hypothetical protein